MNLQKSLKEKDKFSFFNVDTNKQDESHIIDISDGMVQFANKVTVPEDLFEEICQPVIDQNSLISEENIDGISDIKQQLDIIEESIQPEPIKASSGDVDADLKSVSQVRFDAQGMPVMQGQKTKQPQKQRQNQSQVIPENMMNATEAVPTNSDPLQILIKNAKKYSRRLKVTIDLELINTNLISAIGESFEDSANGIIGNMIDNNMESIRNSVELRLKEHYKLITAKKAVKKPAKKEDTK